MYWYEQSKEENGPVLSTRVRFARNLKDTPFPDLLDDAGRRAVYDRVKKALADLDLSFVDFSQAGDLVKNAYVQTHLASAALAKAGPGAGLALSKNGDAALMIGEEDHLRLQVIRAGRKIRETFDEAVSWEKALESRLPVAFAKPWGYLTACPTNLGAAMRISVMIHLPALKATGRLSAVARGLTEAGGTVRGLFGEGTRGDGALYQISNQMSGGKTPEEIVSDFERLLERVELEETRARDALRDADKVGLEDQIFRAAGTLSAARRMRYGEFLELYSLVRLGKEMGYPELQNARGLDRLLVELTPAPMVLADETLRDENKRDEARAARLREAMTRKE
ncbi:MAG: hypothetical protein II776_05670 [Clostridia bacterium]|nr:hypothetical protein [Clostridia bacterium]